MRTSIVFLLWMVLIASGKKNEMEKTPSHSLRIAVVQQNANPGKPEENRNKALRFAKQALDQGADVILFHEELLVGYVNNLRQLAEPVDGTTTRAFQDCFRASKGSLSTD